MPEQSPTRFTMVPARRSSEPTARRRARRILGALFLAAGLSVVAVVVSLTRQSARPDLSSVDPQGRDLANSAAVNFLAGNRLNVPHADSLDPDEIAGTSTGDLSLDASAGPLEYRSLSWVGFSLQHFGSQKAGFTDFELHRFLVVLDPAATPSPGTGATQPPGGNPGASPSPSPAGTPLPTGTPLPGAQPGTQPGAPTGAPSPGGPSVSAPTASDAPSPSTSPSGEAGTAPDPNALQLDVPVLLTDRGPRLAASPSFSPWTRGIGDTGGRGDYTNYSKLTTEVSATAKNQILLWATAYVNGDAAGLLAVTGDQDKSHRYVGLSGFRLPETGQSVQILSAIKAADGQLIVRVRVLLARSADARPFTTFADFDLLVGGPSGAQPPVLAWGPAGSAAELKPYFNARID